MKEKSIEQLQFYGDSIFDIKSINFETGEIKVNRNVTLSDYTKLLSYLKFLNRDNFNIFFSPNEGGCDILLDDIDSATIKRLFADGFEPLYYLETSPKNFQAVIRLSENTLDKDIHNYISRQLAKAYNADPNSADVGHFFRLAGFTNRKEKYKKNGLYPFVKLYPAKKSPASAGQKYIDKVLQDIAAGLIVISDNNTRTTHASITSRSNQDSNSRSRCMNYIEKIYLNSNNSDISSVDFKAVCYALKAGFSEQDIRDAILQYSPAIYDRKKGHVDDYIDRTIRKAMQSV
ncbi:MAG: DNA-primase RepB domain-containing protein [Candidatus Micrarchaeaceae archaeon]